MFNLTRAGRVKRDHRIEDIIRSYGIELKQKGQSLTGLCPFHNDSKTPSLSVTPSKGLWNCFGCEAGGTVIDFIMRAENITQREAIEKLNNGNGTKRTLITNLRKQKIFNPSRILEEVIKKYHQNLNTNETAVNYLIKRGIKDAALYERYRIGFADGGSLREMLPSEGEIIDSLKEIGILNQSGNESFYKCVTFPIKDENGTIVGLYGRSIEGNRQMYLRGPHRGIWNGEAVKVYDSIILTEAVIDALSLVQIGILNTVPLYGANGLTEDHIRLFKAHNTKEIMLCMDNDEAGKRAEEKLKTLLSPIGLTVSLISMTEGIKDINEFLVKGKTKEDFEKLIEKRIFPSSAETSLPKNEGLINSHNDEAEFLYNGLYYKTRGFRLKSFDSLRVVLLVESDGRKHTDRLDLYVAKSRRTFANLVGSKLNVQPARVEENLLSIMAAIEKIQAEHMDKKDNVKAAYVMSEEEKKEAIKLLQSPDLFNRIVNDLNTCGYVGEKTAKKLCYLSATSRKTGKPISVIVRSSSSAGKSNLMERVSELMPVEDVETFSRITPMALYYMPKDHLKNKLLIIDEKAGSDEADYSIRSLQSRDKLTLALPIKDPSSGRTETKTIEMLGPCVIWSSTTETDINPENANRSFELYLDESVHQTKEILKYQREARTLKGWQKGREKESIIRRHRNAQRLLQPLKVIIPYIHLIEFPVKWLRVRRDHERFLSLIEAVTFLHQYQRTARAHTAGLSYVEATLEDYEKAYDLAKVVLGHSLQDISKPSNDVYVNVKKIVKERAKKARVNQTEYTFTRREIREEMNIPDHRLRRMLEELADMEYIVRVGGKQGKRVYYSLVELIDSSTVINGLTTPVELKNKIFSQKTLTNFNKPLLKS